MTVEANSVYHAAVLFYAQSAAASPGLKLPKPDMKTVLEVSSAFRVQLRDAMEWAKPARPIERIGPMENQKSVKPGGYAETA